MIVKLPDVPVFILVVSSLAQYSARLGSGSAFQGKIFGFLGESLDGQLPAVVMKSGGVDDMHQLLIPRAHQVPDSAALTAHYASASASLLMAGTVAMAEAHVPKLAVIPTRWAPYFMDRKMPEKVLETMSSLVAGLSTQAQRDALDPLIDWCKASCVRAGGMGEVHLRSALNATWENPPILDDRFAKWAKGWMARITLHEPTAPVQVIAPVASAPIAADTSDKRNFSEMEHSQIRAACSLTCAQYEQAGLMPGVYTKMLTKGHTMYKVAKVLQVALYPTNDEDTPVNIYVSSDMAKDLKELNFGFGNDKAFDTCHRGISPFGMSAVSQEMASFCHWAAERAQHATMLSMEDIASLESGPGPCPTTYDGLLHLLLAYLKLLRTVCGHLCGHYTKVHQIRRVLAMNQGQFENLSPNQVAHILWGVFLDSCALQSQKILSVVTSLWTTQFLEF